MIVSIEPYYAVISLPYLIYIGNVCINMSTKEDKINERTTIDYNETLNQQQDAVNKTLDNTLHNIRRSTDEARREIPQYTQRITEYQEKTIQTVKDISSDFIEAQKQVINSFQSQLDRSGVWNLYNPERIAENNAVIVNNFTSYLLNTSNLINNALASNMRVYNTALEQTRDNLKTLTKTNTDYIKSVNRHNTDINRDSQTRF
jgi:ABC-type Na+ efflux pump permease subunit